MLACSSCWNWNGGTLNTVLMLPEPVSSAMVASGGDIDTVRLSSFAKFSSPNAAAAAICSTTACTDTFTEGTAMRSRWEKSLIDLIAGLELLSRNGCELSAQIPFTSNEVPCVLSHSVISPGTPPLTMSVEFDSSASFIADGPLKRCQETVKSFKPRCVAYFSINLSRFITLNCR